jgi:methyltransferase (TIGR00027 family)
MPSVKDIMREAKEVNIKRKQIGLKKNKELMGVNGGVSFTARLMAYYRALESKREKHLIFDPFAERLAGDIATFIKEHIRYSEMDYPIVRSYYIEEKLLRPWCINHKKSQIVLLGAGLDTRAYRFEPFHKDTHTIFEIDLPNLNKYKEEILQNEQPLCNLVRLSANLSKLDWISQLKTTGFSREMPTFWVLEGLAYYLEQDAVSSLLTNIAEISVKDSQLFVDIMHASRWFSLPYVLDGVLKDPISRHLKWGLDIKAVPSFFATVGWKVSCSFADDHDQGRNVGQKGMIFVHGIRTNIK